MTKLLDYLKKLLVPFQWILGTIGTIFLYEKFIRKETPQTVVNNDNSTSIEVDKIKKTSGVNEIITEAKQSAETVLSKRLDEIKNKKKNDVIANKKEKPVSEKKVKKVTKKIEKATKNGKPKKVERLKKKI